MPAVSKSQQEVMGMAHAMQKGDMPVTPGTPAAKIASSMKPADVTEFASTPHKGLPEKKKAPRKKSEWNGQPVKKFKG